MITEEQERLFEARGKCGGPFKPTSEDWLLAEDEDGSYYISPMQIAQDAGAPCFEVDEKIKSCPIATAGSEVADFAFDLYNKAERRMLDTVGSAAELTAVAVALLEHTAYAVSAHTAYTLEKRKPKVKGPQQ